MRRDLEHLRHWQNLGVHPILLINHPAPASPHSTGRRAPLLAPFSENTAAESGRERARSSRPQLRDSASAPPRLGHFTLSTRGDRILCVLTLPTSRLAVKSLPRCFCDFFVVTYFISSLIVLCFGPSQWIDVVCVDKV